MLALAFSISQQTFSSAKFCKFNEFNEVPHVALHGVLSKSGGLSTGINACNASVGGLEKKNLLERTHQMKLRWARKRQSNGSMRLYVICC